MGKKPSKATPHLRIRIESKLLARLEKSREKNDRTLTGEIVARLEQSFDTEDRLAIFREAMEKRIQDNRRENLEALAAMQKHTLDELERSKQAAESKFEGQLNQMKREYNLAMKSVSIVDVLLGESKLKSHLLRCVALELANAPEDLLAHELTRRQLADWVAARFQTQQPAEAGQ